MSKSSSSKPGRGGGGRGERVDFDRASNIEFTQSRSVLVCPTFESMSLKPELLRGVYAYGFEKPSAIQQRAIKPIIQGRDVIAQSQSGTGKTAVFSISALQIVNQQVNETQVSTRTSWSNPSFAARFSRRAANASVAFCRSSS